MGQKCTSERLDPVIVSYVESQIHSAKILILSKTTCVACTSAKQLLRGHISKTGIIPTVFEIDANGPQCTKGVINYISARTGINTVPQIWIHGKFVGGNDAVQRLHREGRLVTLILQPVKATPSITLSGNTGGFSKVYPVRVPSRGRDILPTTAFETKMSVNESMPMVRSFRKSNLNYKRNRVLGRSRVCSVYSSPIVSSYINNFSGAMPSLQEVKPVSGKVSHKYMSDEQILSEPSFPISLSENSWVGRERPLQYFEISENEWQSNSRVMEGPLQGISDWINIDQEIV